MDETENIPFMWDQIRSDDVQGAISQLLSTQRPRRSKAGKNKGAAAGSRVATGTKAAAGKKAAAGTRAAAGSTGAGKRDGYQAVQASSPPPAPKSPGSDSTQSSPSRIKIDWATGTRIVEDELSSGVRRVAISEPGGHARKTRREECLINKCEAT